MTDPRITMIPDICGGRPTVRGLRVTVSDVLDWLAGGMRDDEILADYPYLEREDLAACVALAEEQARCANASPSSP